MRDNATAAVTYSALVGYDVSGATYEVTYAGGAYVQTDGTLRATGFTPTSDYRIKQDPQPLSVAEYNVDALNPVTYFNTRQQKQGIGFIAHEIQEHYPFLVTGVKDDTAALQTVDYIGLIGVLVKEIQELKKTVAGLSSASA
jgi:hypothetical protein